jgi:hypothetical protein
MSQDLTNSSTQRQNILNNPFALQEIEKATHIQGIAFEGRSVVFKEQVAAFFEVTVRTVENYLAPKVACCQRDGSYWMGFG